MKIIRWCVLILLLILSLRQAHIIGQFTSTSLRFHTPINGQAALNTRKHAINHPDDTNFWPTFWHESTKTLATNTREIPTTVISFSGDAHLAWPARYTAGTAPAPIDGNGIALSEALANQLFASTDIIGKQIYVNETPRFIRGIFAGNAPLALLPFHMEDTTPSWTGVTLNSPTNPTRRQAETFALTAGLGLPNTIVLNGAYRVARVISLLPFIILSGYILLLLVKYIKKYHPGWGVPLILAGLVVFALCLPFMLEALPPWLIPTRWSDFSFWSSLIQQARLGFQEFLSLHPTTKDILLRTHLLYQIVIAFASLLVFPRTSFPEGR